MKRTLQSSLVFFVLFAAGSLGVDLVQGQSLDLRGVAAAVVVGAIASTIFGIFAASGNARR